MHRRYSGMTLIELVVALTVTAIIASFSVTLISAPPATIEASTRRATLGENATQTMMQVERDWRNALPNSLRFRSTAGVLAVEYLAVLDAAVLFRDDIAVPANQRLTTGVPDTQFETLGAFSQLTKPIDSTALYVAVHHTGAAGANAWALANVITAPGTRVQIDAGSFPGQDQVQLTPATSFTSVGAARRVYILSGPVTYLCNPVNGTLARYSGYTIAANQALRDTDAELLGAGAARSVVATGIANCRIAATVTATASQTTHHLTVTFRSGADQLVFDVSRVGDNAG